MRHRRRQPWRAAETGANQNDPGPVKADVQNLDLPSGRGSIAPARACAFAVVRRVFEQDAWADRALHGEATRCGWTRAISRWPPSSLRHRPAGGHARPRHRASYPPTAAKLDPPVLAALRLGVFQLTFLDRIPAHAAVGESVELAKRDAPRGAGLVNAVLRRAARRRARIVARCRRHTAGQAALKHSHPEWIARTVVGHLRRRDREGADGGRQRAGRAVAARQHAQDHAPKSSPAPAGATSSTARRWSSTARSTPSGRPSGSDGPAMPQSRAAMAVARALAPAPGDACSTCAPRPAARRRTSPR